MSLIIRTQCPDELRLDFLFNRVSKHFLQYEHATFAYMDEVCKAYTGGYWDFYDLSNGGFYMALTDREEELPILGINNGFDGSMSPDTAGIAVSLIVQSRFAWKYQPEPYSQYYYALRDYAAQHEEAPSIFGFIN